MKASHAIATIAQELFSPTIATALIVGRMCRAVEFHDKFFVSANKVDEIGPDGLLPNELEPAEKAASESPPQLAFSLGLATAQLTRPARFVQA